MSDSPTVGRVDILGVGVSTVDMSGTLSEIARWIDTGEKHYICVTGVHGVMESQKDPDLTTIHNRSGLTVPDGMPLVWLGKRAGASHMERVCGPDLTLELCALAAEQGWKSYFYGGASGVPEELEAELARRFPGMKSVGAHSPPFRPLTEDETEEVAARINAADPDIVWVGLSTPKQERWMAEFRSRLKAPVMIGVGAVFDLYTGRTRRAPVWMQRSGLEWLYRLANDPRRLWRRYLTNNPRFIWNILLRPPRLHPSGRGRGRFVVVVGPDGSGKTTVARSLLARRRGRYFHFRPPFRAHSMPSSPPNQTPPPTKSPPPSPTVLGWARLFRNFLSSWIGYMFGVRRALRRGELVVGDRWLYGYLIQPEPLKFNGPHWLAHKMISWLPQPDLVANLSAPAEVIHDRKKELSPEQIQSELQAWTELPVDNLVTLDSRQSPLLIAQGIETILSSNSTL